MTNIDKMLVILPFEKAFFQKWNYETEYVGHPLVEVIEQFKNIPRSRKGADDLYGGRNSHSAFAAPDCPIARKPETGDFKKAARDARSQSSLFRIFNL